MNFKQLVTKYLDEIQATNDWTNDQMAFHLGLAKGNVISMYKNNPTMAPMAFNRVRRLVEGNLTDIQAANLILRRFHDHPDSPTAIDFETFKWMDRTIQKAKKDKKNLEDEAKKRESRGH